jgi:hypothetical protein
VNVFDHPQGHRLKGLRKPTLRFDDEVFRIEDFDNGLPYMPQEFLCGWLAAHWGIDPFMPPFDLRMAVSRESNRRRPCKDCGAKARGRTDEWRCDPCFMARSVRDIRREELRQINKDARRRQHLKTAALISRLPSGRQAMAELASVSSPEAAFAEAYGEVSS